MPPGRSLSAHRAWTRPQEHTASNSGCTGTSCPRGATRTPGTLLSGGPRPCERLAQHSAPFKQVNNGLHYHSQACILGSMTRAEDKVSAGLDSFCREPIRFSEYALNPVPADCLPGTAPDHETRPRIVEARTPDVQHAEPVGQALSSLEHRPELARFSEVCSCHQTNKGLVLRPLSAQPLSTFQAPAPNYFLAAARTHPRQETVQPGTLPSFWLIRPLH